MAFVFGDSFAHYAVADLTKKWTTSVGTHDIHQAYGLSPSPVGIALGGSSQPHYIDKTIGSTLETFIAGVWFRTPSLATASVIMSFHDGGTEHVSVRYTTGGQITFTRNGTVLATSTNTISTATWYHIEVKATIGDAGDSPSGRYQVRVNGTATNWIPDSGTGQDTRNGGNKSISNVRLNARATNAAASSNHNFQHYYLLNTTGSVANDFLGPCRFEVVTPVGAGNAAAWTGNYADNWRNVADIVADGDSTFNQSSTAAQKDKFTMSDVPSGTIHAVQHVLMARQDAGAQRVIRPITRIGGTDYNGTSFNTAASYVFHLDPTSTSPATSTAWTDTEINGAEFGYELVS
jgi:hypothetical protein